MSEEQKEQTKRIITKLKLPLPDSRISFDSHFDIISSYVVASGNGKTPVGYKELEPYIKINPTLVSGCNNFFQHLGFIEKVEGTTKYKSTPISEELHNARQWQDDNLKKSVLQKALEKSWFWNQTRQFLEINQITTKKELIQKLGLVCGADPEKHTSALDKLIDYMKLAELIKEEDGKISINKSLSYEDKQTPLGIVVQSKNTVDNNKQNVSANENPIFLAKQPNVMLGIMISPDMSEEQIRKTVRTVVEELEKINLEKRGKDNGTGQ